ncbi:MAG: GNAT family N-acetyltransferase, partial [Proteobacteria bacterium]|nr:GNAT family N-acetyltransferase [Pseudomonadota bacterium]
MEPVGEVHASDMAALLADPDLHTFIPSEPPTLEKLKSQYKYWESRISPQEDELWLNWIGRIKSNGKTVGHFQAGVKASLEASVAYTIGKEFQRQGFASEGLTKILDLLFEEITVRSVNAWIDTRNL